jgi:hypothetical protein
LGCVPYLREIQAMLFSPSGDPAGSDRNLTLDSLLAPGRFALLLAFLIVAAFPDVLFGWSTFFYRDFGIFGYPIAFHHRESFWRGEIPLWNPLNNCGVPFLAQWNTMTLYPLSLIYLLFPLSWSLGVFCLVHLFLAGLGMYFLARRWTGSPLGASVAGLAFAFCGLTLSCLKWPNNIAALGAMPWVLWLTERGWTQGGRALILAALAGACQMLTGGPEIILFTWLIVAVLCLHNLMAVRTADQFSTPPRRTIIGRLLLIVVLVSGLSAAQLLPFLDLLKHSQREAGYSDASWSMPLWGWANFVVPLFRCFPSHQGVFAQPDQYWISSYYCGITIAALALLGIFRAREARARWLAALGLVALVMSLGESGLVYSWLKSVLPILQIVRFPIKFVVVTVFVLPLLAAFAFAHLRTNLQPLRESSAAAPDRSVTGLFAILKQNTQYVTVGAASLLLIGAILWFAKNHPLPTDSWRATWKSGFSRALLLVGTLLALGALEYVRSHRKRALLTAAFLVAIPLDLLTHAPRLSPTIEPWVYESRLAKRELKLEPEPALAASRCMLSPFADYRLNHLAITNAVNDFLFSRMSFFANGNLLDTIPKLDGFFSLYVREESQVRSLLYAATNTSLPALTRFLGVSQLTAPGELIKWTPLTNFLPLATAGQQPIFTDPAATLRGIAAGNFESTRTLYLPLEAESKRTVTNATRAQVKINVFASHRIVLQTEAEQPAWLVLAQTYYHPWQASVNGAITPLWRGNHAFQALQVPAGSSTVELVYVDRAFRIGAWLSAATLLACLVPWIRFNPRPS